MIIEMSTREREDEFKELYDEYKRLFYTTTLSPKEIRDNLGISYTSSVRKRISKTWRDDGEVNPISRGMLIHFGNWLK